MKDKKNLLVIALAVVAIVMVVMILNQFVNGKSKVGQNPTLDGVEDVNTEDEENTTDETDSDTKEDKEAKVEAEIKPTEVDIKQLLEIALNVGNARYFGNIDALLKTSDKENGLVLDEATYEEILSYFEEYQGENGALDVTSVIDEVARLKAEDDETRNNLKNYTYEDYLADIKKSMEDANSSANSSANDTYDIKDDTEDTQISGYEGMASDLYDADGNKVWTGLGIKGAKEATEEQKQEYAKVVKKLNEAIKESNSGKEKDTNGNDTTERQKEYASDVEILTKKEWEAAYKKNMGDSQFNDTLDSRIKGINGVYTIDLKVEDFYTGYIMANVYGIDKKIEIPEQKIMTSLTKGNEQYKFSVKQYEVLDDNTFTVELMNGISSLTMRGGIQNGNKIYFENVENIFNYDYEYISDATGWVQ